jgi:hypothetical protein
VSPRRERGIKSKNSENKNAILGADLPKREACVIVVFVNHWYKHYIYLFYVTLYCMLLWRSYSNSNEKMRMM